MSAFDNIFSALYSIGIIEYALPFLLVFSLVFAILQKTGILGDSKKSHTKKVNLAISLTFGFAAVIPHYLAKIGQNPGVPDLVEIIEKAFPQVSLILLVILSIMIVLGFFGTKLAPLKDSNFGTIIALFLIVLVVLIYLFSANILTQNTPIIGRLFSSGNKELWNAVAGLAIFGVIIWFITKEPKDENQKIKFLDEAKKLFK